MGSNKCATARRAPQRCPIAAIEHEKLLGFTVVQRMHDAAAQILTSPNRAELFAFNAKKRDFVERIDHPQAGIELQIVDNGNGIAETNMFGAQVAMPIDDAPRAHALGQKSGPSGQETALHGVDVAHASCWKLKTRVEQNAAIIGEAAP